MQMGTVPCDKYCPSKSVKIGDMKEIASESEIQMALEAWHLVRVRAKVADPAYCVNWEAQGSTSTCATRDAHLPCHSLGGVPGVYQTHLETHPVPLLLYDDAQPQGHVLVGAGQA